MELQIGTSLGSQAESEPSQGPEPLPRGDWVHGLETWNVRRGAVNTSREQVLPTAWLEMQCYQPLSLGGDLDEVTTGVGGSSDPVSQHSYPHALAAPFPAAGPCNYLVKPPLSNSSSLPSCTHPGSCSHQHCSPPALVVCQHPPVLLGSEKAGIPIARYKNN